MIEVGNSSYLHAKNGCYLCLSGHNLVSTEVSIEGEGILVICKACITDLARAGGIDVEPHEVVADLERRLEAAHIAVNALADQLADSEGRLERLQNEWVEAVEVAQASRG